MPAKKKKRTLKKASIKPLDTSKTIKSASEDSLKYENVIREECIPKKQNFGQKIWRWLNYKKYPDNHLDERDLVMSCIIGSALLMGVLMSYKNINTLRDFVFGFVNLGGLFLSGASMIFIEYVFRILRDFEHFIKGFRNGIKVLILIVILIIMVDFMVDSQPYTSYIAKQANKVDFTRFNPFYTSGDAGDISTMDDDKKLLIPTLKPKGDQISAKTKLIEQEILQYTNIKRAEAGLEYLIEDVALTNIARNHSLDMVANNYFSHLNDYGENPADRAKRQGYNIYKLTEEGWLSAGIPENLGKMPTGKVEDIGYVNDNAQSIAEAQVRAWMNSPNHQKNLLDPTLTVIGVGTVFDGKNYVSTQDFK